MRILILTPQLPYPPRQGTALRNWGLLSNLAQSHEAHEVWLLSFDEHPETPLAPELRTACRQVATFAVPSRSTSQRLRRLFASGLPDMAWRLWSPEFAARYREWTGTQHFDIIQVEGIELARYALDGASRAAHDAHGACIVFDDHNCEYVLQRRSFETDARQLRRWHAAAYSLVQWQRLRAFERRAMRASHATLCVSPQDAKMLARLGTVPPAHVIPNGIDVRSYDPDAVHAWKNTPISTQSVQSPISTLIFTGKMDFRPNIDAMIWFGREVFPLVRQSAPEARLLIVGQQPGPRLDVLRADPYITITGAVDDVRPYISDAAVYIAPLRVGGGTRFKLLEAMAMRRPIVSTSLGCEGFPVADGQELLIGDSPAGFAAQVTRLLNDPALRDGLVRRAHRLVSEQYDWSVIVPQLEHIYATLLNDRERK
jgi:glycosyltransferase involved in cell wall biosynthesis